jgi:hypothetical protein
MNPLHAAEPDHLINDPWRRPFQVERWMYENVAMGVTI